MAQSKKLLMTVLIIAVAVGVVAGVRYFAWQKVKTSDFAAFRHIGNPEAPIKITEYIDLQCPACAYGSLQLQKLMEQNPNKIYLELRFYPLGGHLHSLTATKFALCAGQQGKFWPFVHLVLERQRKWSELMDAQPAFLEVVEDIQVNSNAVLSCIADDNLRVKILEEKDAGAALGIQSTPTYFVNGKMFTGVSNMMDEVYRLLGIPKPALPFPFTK